jgi:hypothetical protein
VLDSKREVEHRQNKFTAAINGIDLDEGSKGENQRRLEELQEKVWREQYGDRAVDRHQYFEFGIEIEEEE